MFKSATHIALLLLVCVAHQVSAQANEITSVLRTAACIDPPYTQSKTKYVRSYLVQAQWQQHA